MNILSLFDGISCGQIALNRAGIKYNNYYASEIDKNAIKVTQSNYPNTIQLGDVCNINSKDLPKIDLLIGGSPCQGFSFAGKQLNFDDPRSKLFFEYVRLLKELNPKYFLLENVKMKEAYKNIISDLLGIQPIEINSSLVSAQNRKRLYWTNIPDIKPPLNKNIVLFDILEIKPDIKIEKIDRIVKEGEIKGGGQGNRIYDISGKGISLTASSGGTAGSGNMLINIPGQKYRKLTRIECERLQTVPDNYTAAISEPQAKKCLGNGWTVDVIAHLFSFLKNI